ncbi:MAG TPA: hypothetical protein VIY52_03530 [Streptosporangiaceae bacterium]
MIPAVIATAAGKICPVPGPPCPGAADIGELGRPAEINLVTSIATELG